MLKGIRMKDGSVHGKRSRIRRRNVRVARALEVEGKSVLDVGCGNGRYSLYLAEGAANVIGIDHHPGRVATANETREVLGFENVEFIVGDIRDHGAFNASTPYDLIVAWGFLHRVTDPFTFIYDAARTADALSLEFLGLNVAMEMGLNIAQHPDNQDKKFDATNLTRVDSESFRKEFNQELPFWNLSPSLVKTIGERVGFRYCSLLGFGEDLEQAPSPEATKDSIVKGLKAGRGVVFPTARVHMVLAKAEVPVNWEVLHGEHTLAPWDASIW